MNKIIYGHFHREIPLEEVSKLVPPGWKNLVTDLIDVLFTLGWGGNLLQIKEKFGELRFYSVGLNQDMWDRIEEARQLSTMSCVCCGNKAEMKNLNGWISPVCENHNTRKKVDQFYEEHRSHL